MAIIVFFRKIFSNLIRLPVFLVCSTVQNKDMQIAGTDPTPQLVVISDGKLMEQALRDCGITRQFVEDKRAASHCRIPDVFLMTCDSYRNIRIVKKEGN